MNATSTPAGSITLQREGRRSERATLWRGAALTAVAAILFPRLNAVLHEGQAIYQLDTEAAIGIPAILAATAILFATLGRWAWRADGGVNRPAKVGAVCGVLGVVSVIVFFVSAPIVLGGFAVTLGLEGARRAAVAGRRRHAVAAVALGSLALLVGAVIWLLA